MIKIDKKKLADYKKKGYSSALEYRIDLVRSDLSRRFQSIKDYTEHIKQSRLLVRDKGKSYKAGKVGKP